MSFENCIHLGTKQHDLMQHAQNTLGSGNLRLAVQLPEGEDLHEWIAVNSKAYAKNQET